MPNYSIELEDGRTISVEADSLPTPEQLRAISNPSSVAPTAPKTPDKNSAFTGYSNEPAGVMGGTQAFTGDLQAAGRTLQQAGPVVAGAAMGGTSGASTGAIIGSSFGPAGTIIGGTIGGIGGMLTGANEVQKAQEGFQKATMSHDAYQAYVKQLQDDQQQHPLGTALGETAANVLVGGMRPNLKNVAEAGETAVQLAKDPSKFLEWLNNPANADKANKLINVGMGVGMGAINATNTPQDNSTLGAIRAASHVVLGAVLNDGAHFEHITDTMSPETKQAVAQVVSPVESTPVETKPVESTKTPVSDTQAPISATNETQTETSPASQQTSKPVLPDELSGAKPRTGYQDKLFPVEFESDLDKAAYIIAQTKPNARHDDYLQFVMDHTGLDEAGAVAYGKDVKANLKAQAKDGTSGDTLTVPDMSSGYIKTATPVAAPQSSAEEPDLTTHLQTNVSQGVMTPEEARAVMATAPEGGMTHEELQTAAQPHTFDSLINSDEGVWRSGEGLAAKKLLDSGTLSPEQTTALGAKLQVFATESSNRQRALQEALLDPYNPEEVAKTASKNGADPKDVKVALDESNILKKLKAQEFDVDPAAAPRDKDIDQNIKRMGIKDNNKLVADLINEAGNKGNWDEGKAKDFLKNRYGLKEENAQNLSDRVEAHYKEQFSDARDNANQALDSWKGRPTYENIIPKVKDNLDSILDTHIKDQYQKGQNKNAPSRLAPVDNPTDYVKQSLVDDKLPQVGAGTDPQYLQDVLRRATTGEESLMTRVALEGKVRDLAQGKGGILDRTVKWLNSWRKLSLISSLKTASRIGVSQTTTTGVNAAARPIAYGLDRIGRLFGSQAVFDSPVYKNATEGMGVRLYEERHSIFENMKAFELANRNGKDLPTAEEYREIDKRANELTRRVLENSTKNMYETGDKTGAAYAGYKGVRKWMADTVIDFHAGPAAKVARLAMQNDFDSQVNLVKEYYSEEKQIRDRGVQEAAKLKQAGDIDGAVQRMSKVDDDILDLQKRLPSRIDLEATRAAGLKAANMDPNNWSKAIQTVDKFPLGKPIRELFIPLSKVPGSVFGKQVDTSILGLAHHLFYGATGGEGGLYDTLLDKTNAKTGPYDAKRLYNGLALGAVGVGVTAAGYLLRSQGIYTGSFSHNPKDYRANENLRQQGHQEASINWGILGRKFSQGFDKPGKDQNGDLITPVSWVSPIALSLNIGSDIYDATHKSANSDKIPFDKLNGWSKAYVLGSATGNAVTTTVLNEPFFRGIQNLANFIGNSNEMGGSGMTSAQRVLQNALTDLPAQMVPSILKNIAQVTNPNRAAIDYTNPGNEIAGKVGSEIPFNTVPTQSTGEGQPFKKQVGLSSPHTLLDYGGKLLDAIFSPEMNSKIQVSDVGKELDRLYDLTGESKQMPKTIPMTMTITNEEGKKISSPITYQQRIDAQHEVGLMFTSLASDKIGDMAYNNQIKEGKPLSTQQVGELAKCWSDALKIWKVNNLGDSVSTKASDAVKNATEE